MDCSHEGFKTRGCLEVKSPVLRNHALRQGSRQCRLFWRIIRRNRNSTYTANVKLRLKHCTPHSELLTLNYYYNASAFAAL